MQPVIIGDGLATLYCADCLEILPAFAAGSVDAVVTDPPFGIDFKYAMHDDDPDKYEDLMCAVVAETNRIVTDGFLFFWQGMPQCARWHRWFPENYRIFAALKNFTQFRPTPVQYSFDPVIFWQNGKTNIRPIAGMRDYHMGNTALTNSRNHNDTQDHPCARPINTLKYVVELSTLVNQTVLDPFMGSGTTGVAALRQGRKFIGVEIDQQYFEIACERIRREAQQLKLF